MQLVGTALTSAASRPIVDVYCVSDRFERLRPYRIRSGERVLSILALGFLIGLQHALEADHLAAVASLATRSGDLLDVARQAAVWGMTT